MAERFGRAGMALVLGDIEEEPLAATAAELRGHGFDVTTAVVDVSERDDVETLARTALEVHGAVHVVCNNAGVANGGPMAEFSTEDWSWVLGVNMWGVIHGISVFLPILAEAGEGHIVNTASVAGLFASPFMGPYNASKFAVVAISESLLHELTATGSRIGVSVLCPAWVRTGIASSNRNRPGTDPGEAPDSELREALKSFVDQGLDPAEVADRVLQAVVHRQFYILTHEESAAEIRERTDAIVSGGTPPIRMPR